MASESTLISILETSTSPPIYSTVSDYLQPFAELRNLKSSSGARKPQAKPDSEFKSLVRSIAKRFAPFLNQCLRVLPRRLSKPSKASGGGASEEEGKPPDFVLELFDTYKLCLDCYELLSSELVGKPYDIYLQTARLLHCLVGWGQYVEARDLGFGVLERLRALDLGPRKKGIKAGKFLPVIGQGGDDEMFAKLVVEVVTLIVKCLALGRSAVDEDYRKVMTLVEEVKPWFRVLDENTKQNKDMVIITCIARCAEYLVGKLTNFDGGLVCAFCLMALDSYAKSSVKDQMFKFCRRASSSLFLFHEDKPSVTLEIIMGFLDSLAFECKVEKGNWQLEFIDFVSYIASKCHRASTVFCSTVAGHLNDLADDLSQVMTPLDLFVKLYSTSICFNNRIYKPRIADTVSSEDDPQPGSLFDDGIGLSNIGPFLGSLRSYIYDGSLLSREKHSFEDHSPIKSSLLSSYSGNSLRTPHKSADAYHKAYLNLLTFLCLPLAELVNSQKTWIVAGNDVTAISPVLCNILEGFHQFCFTLLSVHSTANKKGQGLDDGFDFNESDNLLAVPVAAFIVSLRTKHEEQNTVNLIKQVIASDWIQPKVLKHMSRKLYYIGVLFYKQNQVNEASKALKLCCRAEWGCLKILCQNGVLGDAIVDSVSDACTRTVFLLDILSQCGSMKLQKLIVKSLENWSAAEDLPIKLQPPTALVQQWVKIHCKLSKSMSSDYSAPTLHCSLGSSTRVSVRSMGKLLQQELLVYERMQSTYPEFSHRMLLKIIDILLQHVFIKGQDYLGRSRILLRKGWALRANSDQGLSDSIQCISEAISIISSKTMGQGSAISHQLAMSHSLRALCIQEAKPNSKEIIRDFEAALNLWLSIPHPDGFGCVEESAFTGDLLLMLCNIADVLTLKGFTGLTHDIYKLMIRFCEWRNVSVEKCVHFLWGSRRLSHALCFSPIDKAFLTGLSCSSDDKFKTMGFWIGCLKASMPLLVGFQLKLSSSSSCCSSNLGTDPQLDVAVDDVKKAASKLISDGPMNSWSAFFAAYLYHDLSERLVASGQCIEALYFAKQAYKLRSKLFQYNFTYQGGLYTERTDCNQKPTYSIQNLRVNKSIAIQIWSSDNILEDLETCYISPWKVLQCYLDSTLQVAFLDEMIGNGVEAEAFLLWGKEISCCLNLPLYNVAFSTVLGKLYREKRSYDLSEEELESAKEILAQNGTAISCSRCRLILEASVNQQLGDLNRSRLVNATLDISHELLSLVEGLYSSALEKLNLPKWKVPVSCPEEVENIAGNVDASSVARCPEGIGFAPSRAAPKVKAGVRKSRRTENAPLSLLEENRSGVGHNTRLTRSRYRSSQKQNVNSCAEAQPGIAKGCESKSGCGFPHSSGEGRLLPEVKFCSVEGKGKCICNTGECSICPSLDAKESELLSHYIQMRWEFACRRISIGLLDGIGMCHEIRGRHHEQHKVSVQSIYVLLGQNPFGLNQISTPPTFLLNLLVKECFRNVFAVELAQVFYNVCWISLKSYCIKDDRDICCSFTQIKSSEAVSWLLQAFVLCREVPNLLKKVSRLLCAIYILSPSKGLFSFPSSSKVLSESHWASYFHQASLGTHLNYQFLLNKTQQNKHHHTMDEQHPFLWSMVPTSYTSCCRVAPPFVEELENFVIEFFAELPCTTVICISLIGDQLATLLQELLAYPPSIHAWLLLSRLNSKNQPVVAAIPVYSSLEGILRDRDILKRNELTKKWHCPWGATVIDEVAPVFRHILEENHLSSSNLPLEDSKENRNAWWSRRKRLDCMLDEFLRSLEEKWLGPWKSLLFVELSYCKAMDAIESRLVRDLKSKCKVAVNQILLKVILGAGEEFGVETCIKQLLSLKNGCVFGKPGLSEEGSLETQPEESEAVKRQTELAVQLVYEAQNKVKEVKEEASAKKEAAILVLDSEVQMLPWENLPTLRSQEVYRLPTVGSISWILDRSFRQRESGAAMSVALPYIDPLDAFYVLNPSGDLDHTQAAFEKWFQEQNLGGKAGSAPTAEELALALRNHDLFIYLGHGSGTQYISGDEIKKLEKCAATLLMGCSSGSLTITGSYTPKGAPLYYLLAGSPVVVSNLWEVTDKDIDRFSKTMLDSWMRERSDAYTDSARCNLVKEFDSMSIKGKGRKKVSKKKSSEPEDCDNDRPTVGSFMAQARDACTLKYLIGAAPVCYGVPTGIRRKEKVAQ
ncbi:unnamed protein product [Linum tenue]|uniref:separase n=1 Tax=Linum tenue TaxID=586396 RepID=A0AAV0LZ32_9ROSI|nr:unnamed protein product [Linum tenue]